MRKIIIGDVHGCADELKLLVEKVGYQQGVDELYQVGDLINRGPDSLGAYLYFKEIGGKAVMGNHEYHLVRHESGEQVHKKWIEDFQAEFGEHYPSYIEDIKTWPFYIDDEDFLLVHAGIVPGVPLEEADKVTMTRIRTWDGTGENIHDKQDPPWYDFYEGDKPVVFGHWAALNGVFTEKVIGLDTGCVYGKKLTALILPERRLVSVNALKAYCPIKTTVLSTTS